MGITVVPLHNLSLGASARIPFGNGFVLQHVPEWVKKEPILKDIRRTEREWIVAGKHALVAEYEAVALGEPDPDWKGEKSRAIQEAKVETAILANIALWVTQPAAVYFTNVFHATSFDVEGTAEKRHIVQQIVPCDRLLCHPNDARNYVLEAHAIRALNFTVSCARFQEYGSRSRG